MRAAFFALPLVGLVGCLMPTGFGTGTGDAPSRAGNESGTTVTEATGKYAPLPTDASKLLPFLRDENYRDYPHDEGVRPSSGPHGVAGVRRYVQPKLASSQTAQTFEHPSGAGAVLELYAADGATRIGWAVSVKLAALSDGGANWYWLEALDGATPTLVEEGPGLGICINCHASGDDYVLGAPL